MAITVLQGMHYTLDNQQVWNKFKPLIVDGLGWPFIQSYEATKTGEERFKRFKTFGVTTKEQNPGSYKKRKPMEVRLQLLHFNGPYKSWMIAQFIKEHQTQHNELSDCKEPVPESKKVTDFLCGIHDPSLGNGLAHVYGDQNLLTNFDACQRYLQTIAAGTKVHQLMQNDRRNISGMGHEGGGHNGSKGATKWRSIRHNKYISPEKWKKLSCDVCMAGYKKREKYDGSENSYKKPTVKKDDGNNKDCQAVGAGTENKSNVDEEDPLAKEKLWI
jgi:hypothetical protein